MAGAKLSHTVVRIHAGIMAFVFAIICGGGLFVMTAWLLIKGGANVGQHLQLLGHFFVGYSVSWKGCFVGLLYGASAGGVVGWIIGMIYNRIVGIRQN